MSAYLVLENGMIFEGQSFGATGDVVGEVVFTTGASGYIETLTDPSNHGQIMVQTFPLIGNYGVISADFESPVATPRAYITKYPCQAPSNFRSEGDLGTFLRDQNIIGLHGIDTRQLTKVLREHGTMNGIITTQDPSQVDLNQVKSHQITQAIQTVATGKPTIHGQGGKHKVALLDLGVRNSTIQQLVARECEVHTFAHTATADEILAINPDGIVLSSGPGNPSAPENQPIIDTIKTLVAKQVPIFGIALGHQLLALANGYQTEKMLFGNRGSNHPVKDMATGRVYITSQNHGYHVIGAESSFVNVNDKTCEGIDYGTNFSVQFNPEAGPRDTLFLFDRFVERMGK